MNLCRTLRRCCAVLPLIALPAAFGQTTVWTGAGSPGSWNDPANWTNGVPGAGTAYLLSGLPSMPTTLDIPAAVLGTVSFSGTSALTITGDASVSQIRSRHSRNVAAYGIGANVLTVTSGVEGLQVGMTIGSGNGIPANTTITAINTVTNEVSLSAVTTAAAGAGGRNFDAGADLTLGGNLTLTNATTTFSVASGRLLSLNGNLSGTGGVANGNVDGTLELRGTNTYAGPSFANTGQIRFFGSNAVSPLTLLGGGFGSNRFLPAAGVTAERATYGNRVESGGNGQGMQFDGGSRTFFTGEWAGRTGGDRGYNITRGNGSGVAVVELDGTLSFNQNLDVGPNVLVRLGSSPSTAASLGGGDNSTVDGTLDLAGNTWDRRTAFNNQGGVNGAGNLVNSSLSTAAIVSGPLTTLGSNVGSVETGGPGIIAFTGPLTFANSTNAGTGVDRAGPGATILRSASVTFPALNPSEVQAGTLVLDHTTNNNAKLPAARLSLGNGAFSILGNNAAATSVTIGDLRIDVGNGSSVGAAEVSVTSGSGATASLSFGALTGLADSETLNFNVVNGGGGVPVINTTHAAGALPAGVTFNRSSWATVAGGTVQALLPSLVAPDAATFESSAAYTTDIDVTGSFTVTNATIGRSLRYAQAGPTTSTFDATVDLAQNGGWAGILVTPTAGAVTINGTGAIDVDANSALTVHHHGTQPLQIDVQVTGAPGSDLVKTGTGTLVITNETNSFYGPAYLYGGTVSVPALANAGSASPVGGTGTSTNSPSFFIGSRNAIDAAAGTATEDPARLQYTGTGHSTNRTIRLVGNARISADGSGPLQFTNAGTAVDTTYGSWNNLTLDGSGSGSFSGALALGHGNLVKSGAGTWTLLGNVTTFGQVLVTSGRLDVSATIDRLADVSVTGGTLGGNASIGGRLAVGGAGTVSPGASAGQITIGAAVTPGFGGLDLAGAYVWELGAYASDLTAGTAGTDWDFINVFGSASLGATSQVLVSILPAAADGSNAFWQVPQSWTILSATSLIDLGITVSSMSSIGGEFTVAAVGNDLVLSYVPVPEPASVALAGAAATLGFALLRRRRS